MLGLSGIIHQLLRSHRETVSGVCHLVHQRVEVINLSLLVFRRTAHEDKILFILNNAIKHLSAILEPLPQKQLLVIPRRGDSD